MSITHTRDDDLAGDSPVFDYDSYGIVEEEVAMDENGGKPHDVEKVEDDHRQNGSDTLRAKRGRPHRESPRNLRSKRRRQQLYLDEEEEEEEEVKDGTKEGVVDAELNIESRAEGDDGVLSEEMYLFDDGEEEMQSIYTKGEEGEEEEEGDADLSDVYEGYYEDGGKSDSEYVDSDSSSDKEDPSEASNGGRSSKRRDRRNRTDGRGKNGKNRRRGSKVETTLSPPHSQTISSLNGGIVVGDFMDMTSSSSSTYSINTTTTSSSSNGENHLQSNLSFFSLLGKKGANVAGLYGGEGGGGSGRKRFGTSQVGNANNSSSSSGSGSRKFDPDSQETGVIEEIRITSSSSSSSSLSSSSSTSIPLPTTRNIPPKSSASSSSSSMLVPIKPLGNTLKDKNRSTVGLFTNSSIATNPSLDITEATVGSVIEMDNHTSSPSESSSPSSSSSASSDTWSKLLGGMRRMTNNRKKSSSSSSSSSANTVGMDDLDTWPIQLGDTNMNTNISNNNNSHDICADIASKNSKSSTNDSSAPPLKRARLDELTPITVGISGAKPLPLGRPPSRSSPTSTSSDSEAPFITCSTCHEQVLKAAINIHLAFDCGKPKTKHGSASTSSSSSFSSNDKKGGKRSSQHSSSSTLGQDNSEWLASQITVGGDFDVQSANTTSGTHRTGSEMKDTNDTESINKRHITTVGGSDAVLKQRTRSSKKDSHPSDSDNDMVGVIEGTVDLSSSSSSSSTSLSSAATGSRGLFDALGKGSLGKAGKGSSLLTSSMSSSSGQGGSVDEAHFVLSMLKSLSIKQLEALTSPQSISQSSLSDSNSPGKPTTPSKSSQANGPTTTPQSNTSTNGKSTDTSTKAACIVYTWFQNPSRLLTKCVNPKPSAPINDDDDTNDEGSENDSESDHDASTGHSFASPEDDYLTRPPHSVSFGVLAAREPLPLNNNDDPLTTSGGPRLSRSRITPLGFMMLDTLPHPVPVLSTAPQSLVSLLAPSTSTSTFSYTSHHTSNSISSSSSSPSSTKKVTAVMAVDPTLPNALLHDAMHFFACRLREPVPGPRSNSTPPLPPSCLPPSSASSSSPSASTSSSSSSSTHPNTNTKTSTSPIPPLYFRGSRYSLPPSVWKSLMQKSVRLCNPIGAVRSALQLAFTGGFGELVRRVCIICTEDALLHPSLDVVVMIACAISKGHVVTVNDLDITLTFLFQVCLKKNYLPILHPLKLNL